MAVYPEKQAKAQAEIDKVVGNDRLPQVSDRESLPYTMALMKEVFRWQPIVPMGVLLSPIYVVDLKLNILQCRMQLAKMIIIEDISSQQRLHFCRISGQYLSCYYT
jgi:hypothetical protein